MSELKEYFEFRGLNPIEGYDPDDFYMWRSEKRMLAEYERLRPVREAQERRWIQSRHESVLQTASSWAADKIVGFVVVVGGFASSVHRDLNEAKDIARANRDFHSDVRLRRFKV